MVSLNNVFTGSKDGLFNAHHEYPWVGDSRNQLSRSDERCRHNAAPEIIQKKIRISYNLAS